MYNFNLILIDQKIGKCDDLKLNSNQNEFLSVNWIMIFPSAKYNKQTRYKLGNRLATYPVVSPIYSKIQKSIIQFNNLSQTKRHPLQCLYLSKTVTG